jgi:hypothetical protein
MKRPSKKRVRGKRPSKSPDRVWRVSLIRKRTEFIGRVWAPNRKAAEGAAVEEFKLDDEQRKRLVVQEQP